MSSACGRERENKTMAGGHSWVAKNSCLGLISKLVDNNGGVECLEK